MGIASCFLALLSVFVFAPPISAAPSPVGSASVKRDLQWQACSVFDVDSKDPNLACAYYEVPLDYHNANAGKARLAVTRYAGTASKKLGTLFLNPGGPAGSGVDIVVNYGQNISSLFEGTYDIVSWDPRGVGSFTIPGAVTCFKSADEEDAFFQNTIVESINYTIAEKFDQQDQNELFSRTDADSNLLVEFGKRCQQGPVGKYLQYIGTSSTVRDLVSLGDAIVGPGKPIDFWGFSYGTVIGIHFLNIFPERAGHVVLDGVVDPKSWVSYKIVRSSLTDAEKTYSVFADACVQSGKARCKLLEFLGDGAKGPDIVKLLDDAHDTAVKLLRAGYTQIPILPGYMRAFLYGVLTFPAAWSEFANDEAYHLLILIFQAAKTLNIPIGSNYHIPPAPQGGNGPDNSPGGPVSHTFEAIIGVDNFVDIDNHVTMKDVLSEIVSVTQTVSQTFGAIWGIGYNFGWPVRSVERLPPFDFSKLKSPVLVIGNTADPVTPFAGAQNAATLLGNHATLVEHLGAGHTSVAEFSTCTLTLIAEYILASKLPNVPSGQHIKCEIDPVVLFPELSNSTTPKPGMNLLAGRRS